MGVHFEITAPEGMPEADEPIASFARCPGNVLMACVDVGHKRLDYCEQPQEAADALKALIFALDEGEDGLFSYDYWRKCDKRWSNGRELARELDKWRKLSHHLEEHGHTPESMVSGARRDRMRKTAWRFLSYFEMGYTIEWGY